MPGVNRVTLLGRLGQDPVARYTTDGTAVANFSIATSDNWADKTTGEKKERTEWHKCVAWRKLAEIINEHFHKGDMIYVEGKLQTRKWDKDGVTRYATEIVVSEFQFCGEKTQRSDPPSTDPTTMPDDDIPF